MSLNKCNSSFVQVAWAMLAIRWSTLKVTWAILTARQITLEIIGPMFAFGWACLKFFELYTQLNEWCSRGRNQEIPGEGCNFLVGGGEGNYIGYVFLKYSKVKKCQIFFPGGTHPSPRPTMFCPCDAPSCLSYACSWTSHAQSFWSQAVLAVYPCP